MCIPVIALAQLGLRARRVSEGAGLKQSSSDQRDLGRPRRCVWCSPRFANFEMTPVLQPRTMKRADAALAANPASRPEKPGKMKSQRFSSPLTVRRLTILAIYGFGGTLAEHFYSSGYISA
jgi:hypothetical protein